MRNEDTLNLAIRAIKRKLLVELYRKHCGKKITLELLADELGITKMTMSRYTRSDLQEEM